MSKHQLIFQKIKRVNLLDYERNRSKISPMMPVVTRSKTMAMGYGNGYYGGYGYGQQTLYPLPEEEKEAEDVCPPCCNSFQGHNCWWEPSETCYTAEFCRSSSMHGLKLVGETSAHFLQRVLFLILFILGILTSFYYGSNIWEKFIQSPTMVTFTEQAIRIENIPFPAITVCNVNNVRKSHVENLTRILESAKEEGRSDEEIQEIFVKLEFMQTVCESTTRSLTSEFKFNFSARVIAERLHAFLEKFDGPEWQKAGLTRTPLNTMNLLREVDVDQSCSEMIPYCQWRGKLNDSLERGCHLFRSVITDFGKCCSFNLAPIPLLFRNQQHRLDLDPEELSEIERWNSSDLNVENLVIEPKNEKGPPKFRELPFRTRSAGQANGLSIMLIPDIDDYLCTTSDSMGYHFFAHMPIDFPHVAEYSEAIGPGVEAFFKITPEVTKAAPEIRDLTSSERRCYFSDEFELQHFRFYSESNCIDECIANLSLEVCGCVSFYMPQNESTPMCHDAKSVGCTLNVGEQLKKLKYDFIADYCKNCLPTCTDVTYRADVSTRELNYGVNDWSRSELNLSEFESSKVSIVHLYFDQDSTAPKIRKRLYVLNDMIANIGGLLGLTLGLSVLSLVELLYFCVVKICVKNLKSCCSGRRCMRKMRKFCCGAKPKDQRLVMPVAARVTFIEPQPRMHGYQSYGHAPLSMPHSYYAAHQ